MKFSRLLLICLSLTLIVSLPAFALPASGGCKHECRTGIDGSGQSFAHCVEYFFGSWQMSGCTETQRCYRIWIVGDYGTYLVKECDPPSCYGTVCFNV